MKFDINLLVRGLPTNPLPTFRKRDSKVPHAPKLRPQLNEHETTQAIKNALRYFPSEFHAELATEFAHELEEFGHIYMYRLLPPFDLHAPPIDSVPAKTRHCAAIMLMILNNLDPKVAQFPQELVTYGGNGQVFGNWAQFWLVMKYLSEMDCDETLVMYSGHPMGVYPSHVDAPRVVITNGMMIPNYSNPADYQRYFALGVTMYGQMTAGSYCYIGPQGIVHGTTLTVLNAGRKYLNTNDLSGKVFVTSGLGGMSGAQPKAAVISGCICVVAEVSSAALHKRQQQGWLQESTDSLDKCIDRIRSARKQAKPLSLGYLGNVVDLWERLVLEHERTGELLVDLGSDQTSCHNPFNGGYYPVQLTFDEANRMIADDPIGFKRLVQESLRRQIDAIDSLTKKGMRFWDYGNAFLLECERAGADVRPENSDGGGGTVFKYPSYVQDIMGDIFSLGFGPFRWVCTSGKHEDLKATDAIAAKIFREILADKSVSQNTKNQVADNLKWIEEAEAHQLVVGSQARILYSDCIGRTKIALAFNDAVKSGEINAPIVISRDHHDVSGTDAPFRETSNIYDGSAFTADMAVQNCIGDAMRGATWVALHNGGGTGWGEAVNGGFGLVLDGSQDAARRAQLMLLWDVNNGVSRRCWSGNQFARDTIEHAMALNHKLKVTLPHKIDDNLFA